MARSFVFFGWGIGVMNSARPPGLPRIFCVAGRLFVDAPNASFGAS